MKTIKHDHLLTKLLKVFIFSLMMLLPFMIWLPNAFYYGFNEHAVAQEKTEQVPVYYQSNEINTADDFIIGNIYHWNNHYTGVRPDSNKNLFILEITANLGELVSNLDNVTNISLFVDGNYDNRVSLWVVRTNSSGAVDIQNREFDFVIKEYGNAFNEIGTYITYFSKSNFVLFKEYQPLTTNMSITDSMSYAWESVWNNSLMTWTNNSILKTPIDNFIGVFAINNDACISNYLIYIMTLTGIYVVIDIVLELFIALTHMFSRETK